MDFSSLAKVLCSFLSPDLQFARGQYGRGGWGQAKGNRKTEARNFSTLDGFDGRTHDYSGLI